MAHGHTHPHTTQLSDTRLFFAVGVNLLLTAAQLVGGVIAGSLALIADALHNFNDAASLGIALIARRIARRPADQRRTFGYRRAEVIGALINTTTLIVIGIYLLCEAVMRWFSPEPVHGWIVVAIAGVALVIDLITAALTFAMAKHSLNIRAAFVHNLADALGSVAVIIAGSLILLFELNIADLIATLLIAGYILWQSAGLMRESIRILMQSVPADEDLESVAATMREVSGVRGVHHLHLWQLDEHHRALEAHVVVSADDLPTLERIKDTLRGSLHAAHAIDHTTLEIELPGSDHGPTCEDHSLVPHH